jgi:stearoyl-CoA desaturase (Delta-9 desaturase)
MLSAVIAILIDIHLFTVALSIYLHRGIAHNQFECSPGLSHVFRFILWLDKWNWKNYQQTYTAQHRKHHLYSDTKLDPHSPYHVGFFGIFDFNHTDPNRPYYVTPEEVQHYASDVKSPDDWMQRHVYDSTMIKLTFLNWKEEFLGWVDIQLSYFVTFFIFYLFFGFTNALLLTLFHYMILLRYIIPFVMNYLFHKGPFSYAQSRGEDKSKILFPIGILFAGEELHTYHHNDPWNPNNARRWFEFDISYVYIKIFAFFKLIKLKDQHAN